ncbi:hypothetical protein D3C80_1360420 [compost metagenome]
MFRAPLYAGITRVGPNHVFLAVQQLVDLGNVCNVGRRPHYAVHQAGLGIGADVGLHAEVILVALLRLVHFRVALAVLVLGRTRRVDQRRIDDGALAQRQATIPQIAIDHRQNPSRQLVLLQQATEIEDGGFVGDTLQAQPGKLAQDRGLVQRLLHRRIAVAEPVLHQMDAQHRHQRIRWTAAFTLGVVRLDQGNQALPRHHLIHLDQEQFLAGLLAFAGVLGVGKGHLLHQETRATGSTYFTRFGKSSSGFP